MSEQYERTSKRTNKWLSTYVPIHGRSAPLCEGNLPLNVAPYFLPQRIYSGHSHLQAEPLFKIHILFLLFFLPAIRHQPQPSSPCSSSPFATTPTSFSSWCHFWLLTVTLSARPSSLPILSSTTQTLPTVYHFPPTPSSFPLVPFLDFDSGFVCPFCSQIIFPVLSRILTFFCFSIFQLFFSFLAS